LSCTAREIVGINVGMSAVPPPKIPTGPLSDFSLRKLKPLAKPYKRFDGGGLHVLVSPDGARYWRMDYRFNGKRKTLALGVYPDVSLARKLARTFAASSSSLRLRSLRGRVSQA
jgi:hypothetical protein